MWRGGWRWFRRLLNSFDAGVILLAAMGWRGHVVVAVGQVARLAHAVRHVSQLRRVSAEVGRGFGVAVQRLWMSVCVNILVGVHTSPIRTSGAFAKLTALHWGPSNR